MKRIALLFATAVLLQACGGNTSHTADEENMDEEMFDEIPDHAEDEHGMSYGEYLETYKDPGRPLKEGEKGSVFNLISIEDGAYPQSTLNAVKHDGTDTMMLNLMLEGGFTGYTNEMLHEAVNNTQVAYIIYAEEVLNYPGQIVAKGTKVKNAGSDDLKASGKLIARAEEMGGDLPGHFYVEKSDGSKVEFTDFWEESLLEMNGKQVDVYYYIHSKNEVKHIAKVE